MTPEAIRRAARLLLADERLATLAAQAAEHSLIAVPMVITDGNRFIAAPIDRETFEIVFPIIRQVVRDELMRLGVALNGAAAPATRKRRQRRPIPAVADASEADDAGKQALPR